MRDPVAASTVRPLVGRDRELYRVGAALSETAQVLRSMGQADRDALAGDLPRLGRLWPEPGFASPPPVQEPELERAADNIGLRQFVTDARRSRITAELGLEGLDPDGVAALAAVTLGRLAFTGPRPGAGPRSPSRSSSPSRASLRA